MLFHFYSWHGIRNRLWLDINKPKVLNVRTSYSSSTWFVGWHRMTMLDCIVHVFNCTTWHNWIILVKSICKVTLTNLEPILVIKLPLGIFSSKLLLLWSCNDDPLSLTWFRIKSFTNSFWLIQRHHISLCLNIICTKTTKVHLKWLLVTSTCAWGRTNTCKHAL